MKLSKNAPSISDLSRASVMSYTLEKTAIKEGIKKELDELNGVFNLSQ